MSSNVGIFCPSGGWVDLAPYLKRDHINVNIFPATSRYYTQYKGTRCALPLLVDSTGLYYNKTLFKKAGITRPPRTLSELSADAKKLTVKNSDGSLKVVGFDPNIELLHGRLRRRRVRVPAADRRELLRQERKVEPRRGIPAWAKFLRWQKSLIDFFGYDKLVRWQAGAGRRVRSLQPFETGKLAMMLDGEWRVAFIKNEHPELQYGTAPMPVDDGKPQLYGGGCSQRDDHRHPEGRQAPRRGLGARQVPDHERPRAGEVLERDPERPVDGQLGEVAGARSRTRTSRRS